MRRMRTVVQRAHRSALTILMTCLLSLCMNADASAQSGASISIYFDSDYSVRELGDWAPVQEFFVIAENLPEGELSGFSFGLETDGPQALLLSLQPVSGTAQQFPPLMGGLMRFEVDTSAGDCLPADEQGRVLLASGVLLVTDVASATRLQLDAAQQLQAGASAPTWIDCATGNPADFTEIHDGLLVASREPRCVLDTRRLDFGSLLPGHAASRTFTVRNDGVETLVGNVPQTCGTFQVTAGAGAFALEAGDIHEVTVSFDATTPGSVSCVLDIDACDSVELTATVVDPGSIGDPQGRLAVYLDPAFTSSMQTGRHPGEIVEFYVVLENLATGAAVDRLEFGLQFPAGFVPLGMTAAEGAHLVQSNGHSDFVVRLDGCGALAPGDQRAVLSGLGLFAPVDDSYELTIVPVAGAASVFESPAWTSCNGTSRAFAEVGAALIQYIDPNQCIAAPGVVEFGQVFVNEERQQTLLLTNTGSSVVQSSIDFACEGFRIVEGGGAFELAPQESRAVIVAFAPTTLGTFECQVILDGACNALTLRGRGSEARSVGPAAGTVSIYFDEAFTQTALHPEQPFLFDELYVVAEDLEPGTSIEGFEIAVRLPHELIPVASVPSPQNTSFEDEQFQVLHFYIEQNDCLPADDDGRIVLTTISTLYLPFFMNDAALPLQVVGVQGSTFEPAAPGWYACSGMARAFAQVNGAVLHPVDVPAPDPPTAFHREDSEDGTVRLDWTAADEADLYRVFRSNTPGFTPGPQNLIAEVEGETHEDRVPDPTQYFYKLSAVRADGVGSNAIVPEGQNTGSDEPRPPARFLLRPAQPNPFNPQTTLAFDLPARGHAQLQILDARGHVVTTLVDAVVDAGPQRFSWDGRDQAGRSLSSGVYFARLVTPFGAQTRKLTLVR